VPAESTQVLSAALPIAKYQVASKVCCRAAPVQRHRELDQRFEINLAPFGSHAVENFASVLLPGR
jgi:hypothetical protein